MNKDQKARKALEWDKKEVYEADAKRIMKKLATSTKKEIEKLIKGK